MNKRKTIVVIDDCQRLGAGDQLLQARLPLVTEQLQSLAKEYECGAFCRLARSSGER